MNFTVVDLLSYAIVPAVIIGWIRFPRIGPVYLPFLLMITFGLIHELMSSVLIRLLHSNVMTTNIYALLECYLMCWFFHNLNTFKKISTVPILIASILTGIWAVEGIAHQFRQIHSYFVISYSVAVVVLSIRQINYLLTVSDKYLVSHGLFWILIGFVFFYTYFMLIEIFWIYGLNSSDYFRTLVYRILVWVNVVINILYAIGLLCLPKKSEYSRPY